MTQDFNWPTTSQPGGLIGSQISSSLILSASNRVLSNELLNSSFGVWSNGTEIEIGTEEVVNGEFTSDTASWINPSNCTVASVAGGYSGNCLEITRGGSAASSAIFQTFSTIEVGKRYKLSIRVKSGSSGDEAFYFNVLLNGSYAGGVSGNTTGAWVEHTTFFTCYQVGATNALVIRKNSVTAGTMLFDNVSIKEWAPSCSGSVYACPDWWGRTSYPTITRMADSSNTYPGSINAIKVVTPVVSTAIDNIYYPFFKSSMLPWLQRFRGRVVTFGLFVKDSAGLAAAGIFEDSTAYLSRYHSGSGDWEWLEVTCKISDSASFIRFFPHCGSDNTVYFSRPWLAFSESIISYGIPASQLEVVHLITPVNIFSASTIAADTSITLANYTGLISTNVTAIFVRIIAQCGTAGGYIDIGPQDGSIHVGRLKLYFPVANQDTSLTGWIPLPMHGSYDLYIDVSHSTTLTLDILSVEQQ